MAYQTSTLQLVVDSTGAQTSVRSLARKLTDLNSVTRATGTVIGAGTAAIAGASAAAITLTKSVAANAKEIRTLSNLANTSTSEFQRMSFAAQSVNIEQDKLSDILKDVNDRVGDFLSSGGGEMQDFFTNIAPKVGVTAEQFRNLSGPQALQLYYDSLEKANLSQAEMTFYLEAMANDLTGVAPLLANNGALMAEMGDKAERLGLVLSDLDLAKLEEFSDVSQQIVGRLDAIGNQIAVALAPYITDIGDQFLGAAEDANSFGDMAEKALFATAAVIGVVADGVESVNRLFQLGGNAVAGFALAVQTAMLQAAETITRGPIDRINKLIEIMNELPGVNIKMVDQPDFVKDLGRMRDLAESAYAESTRDFERIWNAPWPSDNIEEWLATVQDGMLETQDRVNAARNSMDEAGEAASRLASSNGGLTEAQKLLNQAMGAAQTTFGQLRAQFDPIGVATEEFTAKQNQLKLLLDQGAISAENYRQAMILLSQQLRATLGESDMSGGFMGSVETGGIAGGQTGSMGEQQDPWQQWLSSAETAFTDFNALSASAAQNFTTSFGSAFASAINDSESLGDAFANMAQGMSNAILSAIGEMIAQWLVYKAVQIFAQESSQQAGVTQMTANALAMQQMAALNAYSSAAAVPLTGYLQAPAAATAALAATAPYVAGVGAAGLSGMAHDGIDSVPNEGTWLLDRGERVVDSRTNEDLKTFLASANSMQQSVSESSGGGGGGDTYIEIQAPVTVESSSDGDNESARKQGEAAGKALKAVILQTIQTQQKPGGILAGTGKK